MLPESDFMRGGWLGLAYAFLLVLVSTRQNKRLFPEQIALTVGAVLTCQNIFPPIKFIVLPLTYEHFLTDPLAGLEKYLLVAGAASETATLITLYSLFTQALKVIPK